MIFPRRRPSQTGSVNWIVAGLGNPGRQYENTRHNVGFMALDLLSKRWGIPVRKPRFGSVHGMGRAIGAQVLLLRPLTYMNRSGEALRDCLRFYKIPPAKTIVLYDDTSLPVGKLRIREKGSSGGHNGIKSIQTHLRTDAFPRVKIGIGTPDNPDYQMSDWVLGRFKTGEESAIRAALARVCDVVEDIIVNGVPSAMNKYNGPPARETPPPVPF